jgi:hypothetical protein
MSVEYKDLSGGQTDNITTGNASQGAIVENFVITRDKKLETRRGFEVFDSAASFESVVRSTAEKIGELKSCINNAYLFIRKGADVYFKRLDNGVWQKVVSPNATQRAFWTANENGVTRMVEWSGQVYGVAHNNPANPAVSDFLSPMRIYPNNATPELVQIRNMSPPQVPDPYSASIWLTHAITLANELRTKILRHQNKTGPVFSADATTDRIDTGLGSLPSYLSGSDSYDGNVVWFQSATAGGVVALRPYYIENVVGGTFQIADGPGASPVDITSNGTVELGFHTFTFVPTLSPAATDLRSLLALTSDLVYYHNLHITGGFTASDPHLFRAGSVIIQQATVANFRQAANVLNKLKFLFNLHLLAFNPSEISQRQHIGVEYDTTVPGDCDLVLTPYIFGRENLSIEISRQGSTLNGKVNREMYTFPAGMQDLVDDLVLSYNAHVSNTTQHPTATDIVNRVKYNQTYYTDPTYGANNLKPVDTFAAILKLLNGYNGHRIKSIRVTDSAVIHTSTEDSATELSSTLLKLIEDQYLFENTNLESATDFNFLYGICREIANKLVRHVLQGSGGLANTARHSGAAAIPPSSSLATDVYLTYSYGNVLYAFTYVARSSLRGNVTFEQESAPVVVPGVKEIFGLGQYNDTSGVYTPFTAYTDISLLIKTLIQTTFLNTSENQSETESVFRVYRTIENGEVFYLLREGVLSVIDESTEDTQLQQGPELYTTGGVLGNDPAPKSKCFEIINNKAYFGGIVEVQDDGTQVFLPRRLRQSKQNELTASPESFFVDLESDIETIGRAGEYPIVVCKQGVYRIEGEFNDDGTGFMIAKKISDRVGGVSVNGGVTVNDVFFFAGNDGFYMSDASFVRSISSHLKTTYESLQTKHYIQCKHDRENNRIMWTARKTASDNDTVFVLDPKFGAGDELCIYEWNGESFRPHAIEHHNSQNVIGDIQGFVFKQTTATSDPRIVRTGSGSISGVNPIIYRFRSIAEDFQNVSIRKWATRAYVVFEKLTTNLSSQLRSVIDVTEGKIKNMKYVIERSTTYPAGYQGSDIVPVKRTFPVKHLRSFFRQVEVALGKKTDDSSTVNTATITGTNVVISSGNWPANCNGKYLALSNDNYIEEYLIVSGQGTNTLVVATAPGNASSLSWGIRSYPTDERARILAVSMEGENTGRNLFPSKGGDSTSP